PRTWSSQPSTNIASDANPLLLTNGVNLRIIGGVATTQGTKDSSKKSTSLSRETNEYIDV
ncbi:hypothetical protein J1N35_038097, partial [Gossypium stocksii]